MSNAVNMKTINVILHWQEIEIEITYKPQWSKSPKVSHLELCSITPERAPLPVTETGYRSHFFYSEEIHSEAEIKRMVTDWLDEEAQSREWKAYQAEMKNQQLILF